MSRAFESPELLPLISSAYHPKTKTDLPRTALKSQTFFGNVMFKTSFSLTIVLQSGPVTSLSINLNA